MMYNIKSRLIPYPQSVELLDGSVEIARITKPSFDFRYDNNSSDIFNSAVLTIQKTFKDIMLTDNFGENPAFEIILTVNPNADEFNDIKKGEAYFISINNYRALICGNDEAGAFYGAVSFSKLIYTEADKVLLPKLKLVDYPDFPHRGNFIECRYGTEFKTLKSWKDDIDYYASLKFNQLIIGIHGCWSVQYDGKPQEYLYIPFKKYPQLKTYKNIKYYSVKNEKWIYDEKLLPPMYTEDFLGDIIAYGKKKNITITPLFNSLGHNTYLPREFPETSAKKTDGTITGCGFCTKSKHTYELIFNIYDEIIERYLEPNGIDSIHIGMDEVGKSYICHCEKCDGKPHAELMIEYIIRICKHLKEKGMKHIYVYHDMLYHGFNVVNDELKQRFIDEGIYDEVILDWWSYEDPKHLFWDKADGVNNLFRSVAKPFTGYYHWVIPTDSNDNIRIMAKLAKEKKFEGMNAYGIYEPSLDKNFHCLSEACWNVDASQNKEDFNLRYASYRFPDNSLDAVSALDALENIMKDETGELYMNRACWRFEYYHYSYKKNDVEFPQIFPGNVFKFIYDNESECVSYFKYLKENSLTALQFFESAKGLNSYYSNIWYLTAKHYYVLADEYLTMYKIDKHYSSGTISVQEVLDDFKRLLIQREALMKFAEDVRSPEAVHTYLRNMSIFRQYYLDTIAYFENTISKGIKPEFKIVDFELQKTEFYDFLK